MRGIVNQEILNGIKSNKKPYQIKKILKSKYNIIISTEVFKIRYNAIKSRVGEVLPKIAKAIRKDNKRK